MAFDENSVVVYYSTHRAFDTAVVAYVRWWKVLERTCHGIFLAFENVNMPFVGRIHKMEYIHRLKNWIRDELERCLRRWRKVWRPLLQ